MGQKSNLCPTKEQGIKCCTCNAYGNKMNFCVNCAKSSTQSISNVSSANIYIYTVEFATKLSSISTMVKMNNVSFLTATNAQNNLHFIIEDAYKLIGSPPLTSISLIFSGPHGLFKRNRP